MLNFRGSEKNPIDREIFVIMLKLLDQNSILQIELLSFLAKLLKIWLHVYTCSNAFFGVTR